MNHPKNIYMAVRSICFLNLYSITNILPPELHILSNFTFELLYMTKKNNCNGQFRHNAFKFLLKLLHFKGVHLTNKINKEK